MEMASSHNLVLLQIHVWFQINNYMLLKNMFYIPLQEIFPFPVLQGGKIF
jgi:hypothetical protein